MPFYYIRSFGGLRLKVLGAGGIRQTAKAPVDLRILGGFAIYVDGAVDGITIHLDEGYSQNPDELYIKDSGEI